MYYDEQDRWTGMQQNRRDYDAAVAHFHHHGTEATVYASMGLALDTFEEPCDLFTVSSITLLPSDETGAISHDIPPNHPESDPTLTVTISSRQQTVFCREFDLCEEDTELRFYPRPVHCGGKELLVDPLPVVLTPYDVYSISIYGSQSLAAAYKIEDLAIHLQYCAAPALRNIARRHRFHFQYDGAKCYTEWGSLTSDTPRHCPYPRESALCTISIPCSYP